MSHSPERKKLRRESPERPVPSPPKVDPPRQQNAKPGGVLFQYDLLLEIFKFLSAKDLCNCILVCSIWKEAALKTFSRRGPELRLVDADKIFSNCDPNAFPNNLTIKPMFGLVITTRTVCPPDCFPTHLPQKCFSLIMRTFGGIMNECEYEMQDIGICGYFPESKNVDIELMIGCRNSRYLHFNKNLQPLNADNEQNRLSSIEPMFRKAAERLGGIKCMLLITSEKFKHDRKLSEMIAIKENVSSLWGGMVKDLIVSKRDSKGVGRSENVLWAAVLIAGEHVKSWSIIVERQLHGKLGLKLQLQTLRSKVVFYKHTVGLILACVERGSAHWGEPHVEASMFKKVFPEVPLIGAFGNGEIGFNFTDNRPNRRAQRAYSTTFMIITYE